MLRIFFNPGAVDDSKISETFTPYKADSYLNGVNRLKPNLHESIGATVESKENPFIVSSDTLKVKIHTKGPLKIEVYFLIENSWILSYEDSSFNSYVYSQDSNGDITSILHRQNVSNAEIYGLGEVPGSLEHSGKRITMYNSDSMGYNAAGSTYSLYKHFPFYISRNKDTDVTVGILYDDISTPIEFDFNHKLSSFTGNHNTFCTHENIIDLYLGFSNQQDGIVDVVKSFGQNILGRPTLPPKWALGYVASAMSYSDANDAQEKLSTFPKICMEDHQMPCKGFYLSSGYTMSANKERHVFTWAKSVPQPRLMTSKFKENDIKIIPNVKPWYLTTHPEYKNALALGVFLSGLYQFWKGVEGSFAEGQYFDFRKEVTCKYWIEQVRKSLVSQGIDHAIWNDNNEYEVPSSVLRRKPLQSLLMAKASLIALSEESNTNYPLVVSRSGCLGIHRFSAQTWSGDNDTTWETLRYNILMSLNLSLSLWVGNGFDVGGFTGKQVTRELFQRWVEVGIFFPRFTIHSATWKENNHVNSPWMFKEIENYIRILLQFRHQLIIYIDSLYIQSYLHMKPIVSSPLFHRARTPHDTATEHCFLLGDIFVCPIVEECCTVLDVSLPDDDIWVDFLTAEKYEGGSQLSIETENRIFQIPFFIRFNSCLILAGDFLNPKFVNGQNECEESRYIYIIGNSFEYTWYERAQDKNSFLEYTIVVRSKEEVVSVESLSLSLIRDLVKINTTKITHLPTNFFVLLNPHDNRVLEVNL